MNMNQVYKFVNGKKLGNFSLLLKYIQALFSALKMHRSHLLPYDSDFKIIYMLLAWWNARESNSVMWDCLEWVLLFLVQRECRTFKLIPTCNAKYVHCLFVEWKSLNVLSQNRYSSGILWLTSERECANAKSRHVLMHSSFNRISSSFFIMYTLTGCRVIFGAKKTHSNWVVFRINWALSEIIQVSIISTFLATQHSTSVTGSKTLAPTHSDTD